MTRAGPGLCHLSHCYLQRERPRSGPGEQQKLRIGGKGAAAKSPPHLLLSAPGAGMDRATKPELRSAPGCPENPGEPGVVARKDGWGGGTGGNTLWKSLSSLAVGSARVLGCLRSRRLGCESQSSAPGRFGMIWERAAAAGSGGTPCWHFISSQNSIPPNAAAAAQMSPPHPFTPRSFPSGVLSKEGSIPQHPGIPLHIPALLQNNAGDPPNKKITLGKKAKGGRTVGFALLIPDLNWP